MKLLVFGGREFGNPEVAGKPIELARHEYRFTFELLDLVHALEGITAVISGMAKGADSIAAAWAKKRGVPLLPFPADWTADGKAAGPRRNQRMLDEGQPDLAIGLPGGKGSADMASRLKKAGVWHMLVSPPPLLT